MASDVAIFPSLGQALGAAVAIRSVTVETQFTPPYTYTPGPSGEAPSGGLLRGLDPLGLLRPRFTIQLEAGGEPIVIAPRGAPTGNYFPHAAGAVAGVVAGIALWKGAKSLAKGAGLVALGLLAAGYLANTNQDGGSP